ncbi:hypothetical protein ASF27_21255 [Methylobacterium sp. Leaf102]|uniref:hypothetical protein n=1 Tax=Methylobacterium sp. Leaf102 TaxID=1736253 RepID=UPI0006F7191B|nr:hypothetical protein [Methylobacterium sp. Leaf102]KQP25772.1 hypothetical protein ASF27_21255 [Methylobacterium sp. Leaf102]
MAFGATFTARPWWKTKALRICRGGLRFVLRALFGLGGPALGVRSAPAIGLGGVPEFLFPARGRIPFGLRLRLDAGPLSIRLKRGPVPFGRSITLSARTLGLNGRNADSLVSVPRGLFLGLPA